MKTGVIEADKPSSRKLYKRKGWKGFVHSYANYIENSSYDDVKWDKETKAKEVIKDDFVTIYKY
jgi:hypothetical protein